MFPCSVLFLVLLVVLAAAWKILLQGNTVDVVFWSWFNSELLNVKLGLQFDSLSCVMLVVVLSISLLVHIYSFKLCG